MVKRGIVVAADGKMATIEEIKGSYCFECIDKGSNKNCINCLKRTQSEIVRHISSNDICAEIGDTVEYSKKFMSNFLFSIITFVLPILLALATYVIFNQFTESSGRIALAVLAVSMLFAAIYSYKYSKIRCDYKIISKI